MMTTHPGFGHHPNPAVDFCIEVECIQSMTWDSMNGGRCHNDDDTPASREILSRRIDRAMDFRVGGDPDCIAAKALLRDCEKQIRERESCI